MLNYQTTVTFTLSVVKEGFADDYDLEVVLSGYNGNDGGQSDVEAPTVFTVDGVDVDPYNDAEMNDDIRAALFDMEVNHNTNKNYKVREA